MNGNDENRDPDRDPEHDLQGASPRPDEPEGTQADRNQTDGAQADGAQASEDPPVPAPQGIQHSEGPWDVPAEMVMLTPRRVAIPRIFHSLETERPFRNCIVCRRWLWEGPVPYMIERVFRGREPILEYAMCLECQEESRRQISAESRRRIEAHLRDALSTERLMERWWQLKDHPRIEPWLRNCVITGKARQECAGYQIMAYCEGAELLLGGLPMMISDQAMEEISSLLSVETKGWMNDFVGDHFGMSPEFTESPSFYPVLL